LLPTENFFRAASLCPTDYVALCDQDDVWDKRKIELCDRMAVAGDPDLIVHSIIGAKAYRDLAEFCREMALFYQDLGDRPAAKSYYERWSRLWFKRKRCSQATAIQGMSSPMLLA
jgi:hypothetical protein